jgi:hypothetical protein
MTSKRLKALQANIRLHAWSILKKRPMCMPLLRGKQIMGWLRAKKIALIESLNPEWRDLGEAWKEG